LLVHALSEPGDSLLVEERIDPAVGSDGGNEEKDRVSPDIDD
jgi:hypothetical protein